MTFDIPLIRLPCLDTRRLCLEGLSPIRWFLCLKSHFTPNGIALAESRCLLHVRGDPVNATWSTLHRMPIVATALHL